jgi:hypothetical protein
MREILEALLHDIDAKMPMDVNNDTYLIGRVDAFSEIAVIVKRRLAALDREGR